MATRTISDTVTAKMIRTSDASYHADVDAESQCSHRYDRQPSGDCSHCLLGRLRNETNGPQDSEDEKADDEPGNEMTPPERRRTARRKY